MQGELRFEWNAPQVYGPERRPDAQSEEERLLELLSIIAAEGQPHDPQDYRDRNPMAPDPSLRTWAEQPTGVGGSLLKLLEAPPLAGPSRAVAAAMDGGNPVEALGDMSGTSREAWEALEARGWHWAPAMAVDALIPDLLMGPTEGVELAADAARFAPAVAGAAPALVRRLTEAGRNAAGLVSDAFGSFNPEEFLDFAIKEGGATIDPRTGRAYTGTGHAVATHGAEARIPLTEATPEAIRGYVAENLQGLSPENRYVGAWVDDGDIVLDTTEIVPGREEALQVGARNRQEAIFDIETGELVSVPPSSDSLSPALREYATSRSTPVFHRKPPGPRTAARIDRIETALTSAFQDPQVSARLREVVDAGVAARADRWYDVSEIRDLFRAELGDDDAAEELLRVVTLFTAATSPGTPVTTNIRRGLELTHSAFAGMSLGDLENFLLADKDAVGAIYGQSLSGVLRSRDSIRQAFETGMVNGQKIGTFNSNFLGNSFGVTVDTHNLAGLLHVIGMDFRTPQGRQAIAQLLEFNPDPQAIKEFRNAGITSWADADPQKFREYMYGRVSQKAEYGAFERVQQQLAQQLGITPREFQAALWVGLGDVTGVRNSAPFSELFMRQLDVAAERMGTTRGDVIRGISSGTLALGAIFAAQEFDELMSQRGSWTWGDDSDGEGQAEGQDPLRMLGTFLGDQGAM